MARQAQKRTVDGFEFEIFPIPPRTALRVMTRLTKILAEPFGLIMDGAGNGQHANIVSKVMLADFNSDSLSKAMRALTERLDENEVWETITQVLDGVHGKLENDRGTRALSIDADFAGRPELMLKVFVAALEVNFSGFFGDALAKARSRLSQAGDTNQPAAT